MYSGVVVEFAEFCGKIFHGLYWLNKTCSFVSKMAAYFSFCSNSRKIKAAEVKGKKKANYSHAISLSDTHLL